MILYFSIIVYFIFSCHASIVDTKYPIVISDLGTDPNYFGYSLAFTSVSGNPTLFIGAPKQYRWTVNSGVVWSCHFDNSKAEASCSVVNQISGHNSANNNTCSNQLSRQLNFWEVETNQWIGANLEVKDDQLFACAPRWKLNGFRNHHDKKCNNRTTAMPGACFSTSLTRSTRQVQEINPLNNPSKYYYDAQKGGKVIGGFWYLYGHLGFSSHIMVSNNILVLGAPMARERGMLVEYNIFSKTEFLKNDKDSWSSIIEMDSLLGYSLASGRYKNQNYIFSGAPRAGNLHGIVTISSPGVDTPPTQYVQGDQFGSYFGYTVASADLDGNNDDELLVGAPFYTPDLNSPRAFDIGCVFIYRLNELRKPPHKICPLTTISTRAGRFGSAICNLGDINADGKHDFAVGAPYADDGVGMVYIYHGDVDSKTKRLSAKLAQEIQGKALNIPKLRAWGSYLLGGGEVDVDGNGTPDLVASSSESRHVIVLRTRPIAEPTLTVTFHTDESSESSGRITKLEPNRQNFRVRICFEFKFSITLPESVKLDCWINYKADSRLKFENEEIGEENRHQFTISASSRKSCLDEKLDVVKDLSTLNEDPSPLRFEVTLKYNATAEMTSIKQARVNINGSSKTIPTVRSTGEYSSNFQEFSPFLPVSMIASTEQFLPITSDNCDSDNDPTCDPDLEVSLRPYYQQISSMERQPWKPEETLVMGRVDSIALSVNVTNKKETAYRPIIQLSMNLTQNFEVNPNLLQWTWAGPRQYCKESVIQEQASREQSGASAIRQIECRQSLHGGRFMEFEFIIGKLSEIKVNGKADEGILSVRVDVYPMEQINERKQKTLQIPMKGDVRLEVKNQAGQDDMKVVDPKLTKVLHMSHFYIIQNLGYSATTNGLVKADIFVPSRTKLNGKDSIPLVGVADPSTPNMHCRSINFVFFDINNPQGGYVSQKKRNETLAPHPLQSTKSPLQLKAAERQKSGVQNFDKYTTLDCFKLKGQHCGKLECYTDIRSKESRQISLQLYILTEDLGIGTEKEGIRMLSSISLFYQDKLIGMAQGSSFKTFTRMKGIPAWIYLAAGGGSTVLLLLLTFGLFKCGFFRREKKAELKRLIRQTINADDDMWLDTSFTELQQQLHQN